MNVPVSEMTRESLEAHALDMGRVAEELQTTCTTQDAAIQKAQLELGQAGLTAMRLREVLGKITTAMKIQLDPDLWMRRATKKGEAALALPKTQAEEDLVTMACRIKSAENQIQWCYDMLGKNINGSELSSVRISLREAMRSLEASREAGVE